jgi:hypothetical protein
VLRLFALASLIAALGSPARYRLQAAHRILPPAYCILLSASQITNLIEKLPRHCSFRQLALPSRATRTKLVLRRKRRFGWITHKRTVEQNAKSSGFLVFVDTPIAGGNIRKVSAELMVMRQTNNGFRIPGTS